MGSSSFFAKIAKYDPVSMLTHGRLNSADVSKTVDPVMGSIVSHQERDVTQPPGPAPVYQFAGKTPTLANANAGYVQAAAAAQNAAGGNQAAAMNNLFAGQKPPAMAKPQPMIPGQTQQQQVWSQ